MKLIDSNLLKKLVEEKKALFSSGGLFSELIRRLILSSGEGITDIRIPTMDDVRAPGFDGKVVSSEQYLYVGKGTSVWEFGTSEDYLSKINEDYNKRTTDPCGMKKDETIFYLVTPYLWANPRTSITEWENSKKDWKKVVIVDGSKLCDWLEIEMNVAIWLIEQCNAEVKGYFMISSVENAWDNLSKRTEPILDKQVFLTGRDDKSKLFVELVNSKDDIRVKSDSLVDALGFTLSTLKDLDKIRSEVIVVGDQSSYRKVDKVVEGKILVLTFPFRGMLGSKNKNIILLNNESEIKCVDIALEALRKEEFIAALKTMKISDGDIYNIIDGTHRNLPAVIRRISNPKYIDRPKWATKNNKNLLLPLLLMKNIISSNATHRKLVELITEESYSKFETTMREFVRQEDSPIKQVENVYCIMSFEEAWGALIPNTSDIAFSTLFNLFESIMLYYSGREAEILESYKIIVNCDGMKSIPLRELFQSLVFYSLNDDYSKNRVDDLVKHVITLCKNVNGYNLLLNNFSILAEAAPNVVALFLESQLKDSNSYTMKLFSDRTFKNDYCKVLWTLEVLLYFDDTKIIACKMLAKLKNLNLKYAISNSPNDSLSNALCLWDDKNVLTLKEKKELVLEFLKEDPIEFSFFALELINKNISSTSRRLIQRGQEIKKDILIHEYCETINEIASKIIKISLANKDLRILSNVIECYNLLFIETLKNIVDGIVPEEYSTKELQQLYCKLLEKISNIKKYYKNKEWSGRENYIPILAEIAEKIKSKDLFLQNECFFQNAYFCPKIDDQYNENEQHDYQIEDKKRFEFKSEKYKLLKKQIRPNELHEKLVSSMSNERWWGWFLSGLIDENEFFYLTDLLLVNGKLSILEGLLNNIDLNFVRNKIKSLNNERQNKVFSLLDRMDVIDLLDNEDKEKAFWNNKILSEYNQKRYEAIRKYNPIALIDYYSSKNVNKVNCSEVVNLLEELINISTETSKDSAIFFKNYNLTYAYEIKELFNGIDAIEYSERIARIELNYYANKIITEIPEGTKRYFFENPKQFLDLLLGAENLDFLIDMQSDFILPDCAYLNYTQLEFFAKSLIECSDIKEKEKMASFVGNILGRSKKGFDEIFPHETVRQLIQELNIKEVKDGFRRGTINRRGTRYVGDGKSEKDIAKKYRKDAKTIGIEYPAVAEVLKELAAVYEKEAVRDYIYSETNLSYD